MTFGFICPGLPFGQLDCWALLSYCVDGGIGCFAFDQPSDGVRKHDLSIILVNTECRPDLQFASVVDFHINAREPHPFLATDKSFPVSDLVGCFGANAYILRGFGEPCHFLSFNEMSFVLVLFYIGLQRLSPHLEQPADGIIQRPGKPSIGLFAKLACPDWT
ncbi:MAG: hypothetical protein ACR2RF_29535 [Geminicoccaceae bacterium]